MRRNKIEKLIADRDGAKGESLYEKVLQYFTIYDATEYTNHTKNIRALYGMNTVGSGVAVGLRLFLSESTLLRYRRKYSLVAKQILSL
ncbi:MAG: hypothetical protein IJY62_06035 [Clostridia bacterium]|nr:hypothetical protein [Clostridia bacterium]